MPYLQAKLELVMDEVRTDQHVEGIAWSILRDERGTGQNLADRAQRADAFRDSNEKLIIAGEVLHSLAEDSSVVNANTLVPLTTSQQELWKHVDFTKMGSGMHIHERMLVDLVVRKAIDRRLRQPGGVQSPTITS
jgi:hypothetical protein